MGSQLQAQDNQVVVVQGVRDLVREALTTSVASSVGAKLRSSEEQDTLM
jgi:hypothetical protein